MWGQRHERRAWRGIQGAGPGRRVLACLTLSPPGTWQALPRPWCLLGHNTPLSLACPNLLGAGRVPPGTAAVLSGSGPTGYLRDAGGAAGGAA